MPTRNFSKPRRHLLGARDGGGTWIGLFSKQASRDLVAHEAPRGRGRSRGAPYYVEARGPQELWAGLAPLAPCDGAQFPSKLVDPDNLLGDPGTSTFRGAGMMVTRSFPRPGAALFSKNY